jgi:hypothetical protein
VKFAVLLSHMHISVYLITIHNYFPFSSDDIIPAVETALLNNLNHWVMHPVARVSTNIYIESSIRNKCRCSFYCALSTLHVSAPTGGHLQVVCNTKNSKAVTVYVNGSVASVRINAAFALYILKQRIR